MTKNFIANQNEITHLVDVHMDVGGSFFSDSRAGTRSVRKF